MSEYDLDINLYAVIEVSDNRHGESMYIYAYTHGYYFFTKSVCLMTKWAGRTAIIT